MSETTSNTDGFANWDERSQHILRKSERENQEELAHQRAELSKLPKWKQILRLGEAARISYEIDKLEGSLRARRELFDQ